MPETPRQEFNMTYPELITVCNTVHTFMERDAAEFLANFNVTSLMISAFETKINQFENYPTDDELKGLAQQKTQEKDAIADTLRIKIRSVAIRAKNVFGENSGNYNSFSVKDMNNFDDSNLLICGRRVARIGETFLPELSPVGLTQAILDDLTDTCESLETAIDNQKIAFGNRNDATKVRVDKANELYRLLVTYCDYGKDIWYNTNTTKYNCYVIFQPSPGALTPPTDLYFYFSGKSITWSEVPHATSYQLQCSIDGVDYQDIYSGPETSYVYQTITEGTSYIRVRARNSNGYGEFSEILEVGYYQILPPPQNLHVEILTLTTDTIKLTFNAVPSATKYKIYKSTVNYGDPAGSYIYADTVYTNEYIETVAPGSRYWYRATAENNWQASGNSSSVYIQI